MIIRAAADLFSDQGYVEVSMTDIARAVNVQPSALYRHFASKQDLLREAIAQGVQARTAAVALSDEALDLEAALRDLADSALSTRSLSMLWTTELRSLDHPAQQELRRAIRALPSALRDRVASARPELDTASAEVLAWAALDVLASISFHEERMGPGELELLLREAMRRVVHVDASSAGSRSAPGGTPPSTRRMKREAVLHAAAQHFSRRGFSAVTLNDIGAAVDMAGASLYSYFPSKQAMLRTLVLRSMEWQQLFVTRALRHRSAGADELHALVSGYAQFVFEEPALASIVLTESRHLQEHDRVLVAQLDRDLVGEWVDALRSAVPDRSPTAARVQVHASRMVALDVLQTPHLRGTPDVLGLTVAACLAVLDVRRCAVPDRHQARGSD